MILGRDVHVHAACFDELDAAVASLLAEQGDESVVCFNAHAFPAPPGAVIFNLENVPKQVPAAAWSDREVWDFSYSNAKRLREGVTRSRPVHYVPVGYHESMTRFTPLPMSERDVDVAFAGTMNERRHALLESIKNKGFIVAVVPHTAYGAARDAVFARSKLILNPRFYEDGLYPQLRTLHALSNKILTVSEEAPESPLWSPIRVPYEAMAERVEALLRRETLDSLAARSVEATRILMHHHPMQLPVDL